MSVSVSQIGIDHSLNRSIDQSRFPGQSLDQSICVCRCLYKEQHRPRALTSAVRSSPPCRSLLYLFISSPQTFARLYTKSQHHSYLAIAPKGLPRRFSNAMLGEQRARDRENAYEMQKSTRRRGTKGQERDRMEDDARTDDQPGFLERN